MSKKPVCEAGFIVHDVKSDYDLTKRRLVKKLLPLKVFTGRYLHEVVMPRLPIVATKAGFTLDVVSPAGATINMIHWAVPFDAQQMKDLQPVEKVIEAGLRCQKRGAKLIGLGAFTSIIGEEGGGQDVAKALNRYGLGVTTGNSLTVGTGVEGTLELARRVGYDSAECTAVVIGAGGSIGSATAKLLARHVKQVILVGKPDQDLSAVVVEVGPRAVQMTLEEALPLGQIVITVTSDTAGLKIDPRLFRSGAVVCDIARPRNIGPELARARPDVLVFEGAILKIPGPNVINTYDYGFPSGTAYACMSETMVLALERRYGNFSLGVVKLDQVDEIMALAKKHGFELAGWRSFDAELPESRIEAHRRLVLSLPVTA